jgi:RimJ/RimL family protein N-acetyltransferase
VVPFLPARYILADGTPIIVRSLRNHQEIRSYYAALKTAIANGAGYGIDELPDIKHFVRWYVSDFYNFIFELAPTPSDERASAAAVDAEQATSGGGNGRIIAYSNCGPTVFSRSVHQSALSDGNFVMLPEFRGRGWAAEMHQVQFGIAYDVGIRRVFGETSTMNLPSMLTMRRAGVIFTGSIPRGIYFKDAGWTDLVTLYRTLDETVSFKRRQQRGGQQDGLRITSKI